MEWLINIACLHFGWRIGRGIERVTRKGTWQEIKDACREAEPTIDMTFAVNRRMYELISGLKATLDAKDNGEAILKAVYLASLASSMGGADRKITVAPSDESILPLTVFLTDPQLFHPLGA